MTECYKTHTIFKTKNKNKKKKKAINRIQPYIFKRNSNCTSVIRPLDYKLIKNYAKDCNGHQFLISYETQLYKYLLNVFPSNSVKHYSNHTHRYEQRTMTFR